MQPSNLISITEGSMANIKLSHLLLLFFLTFFLSAHVIQGSRTQVILPLNLQGNNGVSINRGWRRLMIGSTAPTCTYNECRGCRYKCSAEQVPVEGNDPIHSAYRYRCVCHRS